MGAILSCAGSIIGSCAASCACAACSKMCGCKCLSDAKCAHYLYVMIITLGGALSLALRYGAVDLNVGFDIGINGISTCHRTNTTSCDGFAYSICSSDNCKGYWAVYRVSFTMAVFFGLMMLFTCCKTKSAAQLHLGFWIAKILVLAAAFGGTLFMPNDVFGVYAWVARFISPIFTFFMLTMFIDFGYNTNALFIEKDEQEDVFFGCPNGGNTYKIFLLLLTLGLYTGSWVGTGYMYANFPGGGDCTFNSLAITTNLVFGIVTSLIGMTKIAPHASIFVSALVTAYTTWMVASALSSFPLEQCNPSLANSGVWWLVLSCVIMVIAIAYIATQINRWTQSTTAIAGGGGVGKVNSDEVTVQVIDEGASSPDSEVEPQAFGFYHLLMFATSLYLAMLLTDWGVSHGDNTSDAQATRHNVGFASAWLKLAFTWACSTLYLWTLIAPRCCPDRDFGVELEPLCDD